MIWEMSHLSPSAIQDLFDATEPRRSQWLTMFLLAMAAISCLLLYGWFTEREIVPPVIAIVLPWAMLLVLVGLGWHMSRGHRDRRRRVNRAWERIQLEEWDAARPLLEKLFDAPISSSTDRAQAFVLLASMAEHDRQYDAAALIYEQLLRRRLGDPLTLQQAQIALAAAKLHNHELTDAVDLLNRLENVQMPPGLRATLDLVRLFQQVFMGHFDDAVAEFAARRDAFREYLSTRAGYGYALLAAALHHLGRKTEAAKEWSDATTLVRAERLIEDFPLLDEIAAAYPATEHSV